MRRQVCDAGKYRGRERRLWRLSESRVTAADKRGSAFSKLSNEQKASFSKVNLALQFLKRPNMTKAQQEFVLEAISKVSADIYDKTDYEKTRSSEHAAAEMINIAFGLFERRDAGDFIEPIHTPKNEEAALIQKYEDR